jgi:hypothetical protein
VLTLLVYLVLALVAVGGLYGLAVLFLSREQISPASRDRAPWGLKGETLQAEDIVEMRLPVALRGYRFAETDLLLDRLSDELRVRDDEIARLRAAQSVPNPYALPDESCAAAPFTAGPDQPAQPAQPAQGQPDRGW